ncbi:hydantoinase B/oxoprolinase family protein [Conexibacter sp. CPCC 206217]|uniref:hydantoinase B/oxoprolinase family protein n=1 Tax=Conexibacter sp. CPCC 206217 TaxID=3064574 RepID=UPI002717BCB6|nr:hydantoinase B/oxoprolinase family protein [Conexibacter sp. CPCC 206217]MDO8208842.1 hydantoinase B/oxoprolinase family protein [Conexibacter sp. CPCC 206217]
MTAVRHVPALEVFRHAFEGIAEEMGATLLRSSYTVVIKDLLDYSCALFDASGALVAQAGHIPSHLGSMGYALKRIVAKWGEDVHPDDVFVTNDPFDGGTHVPDIHIFMPIFAAGRRIGFAGSIAHHADWGGRVPGSISAANESVFEEGVVYSHLKLEAAGVPNEALYEVIASNIRQAPLGLGDLRAQIAAARTAVRRFDALLERHGADAVVHAMSGLIDRSARATRRAIAALPDGRYEAEGFLDGDGVHVSGPLRIAVALTIAGEALEVDFAGTVAQQPTGINVPLATTQSAVLYAVRTILDDSVPTTEGCLAPISIRLPERSLVNPSRPAPVSDRHLTSQRLADVLVRCLAQLRPQETIAGCFVGSAWMSCAAPGRKTGDEMILLLNVVGGAGAGPQRDGLDAVDTHLSSSALIPAEVVETEYPLRVEQYALLDGTGGAGARAGGRGMRAVFRVLGDQPIVFQCGMEQTDPRFGAWGLEGGETGRAGHVTVIRADGEQEERIAGRSRVVLAPGDRLVLATGGGGGHGALERGGAGARTS